jgi:hypothetical protein
VFLWKIVLTSPPVPLSVNGEEKKRERGADIPLKRLKTAAIAFQQY